MLAATAVGRTAASAAFAAALETMATLAAAGQPTTKTACYAPDHGNDNQPAYYDEGDHRPPDEECQRIRCDQYKADEWK